MTDLVSEHHNPSESTHLSEPWNVPRPQASMPASISPPSRWSHRSSNLVGRVVALILFIAVLPVIVLAVVLVRLTSRGPVFYRQVRMGLRGKAFHIYKIRTMIADAEARTGPVWASENDPRVTPVGRLLRKLNWDELPQLINIVKGDMAFVGPRPERPEIAQRIIADIPEYAHRTFVKPGVTGLAQINLPADSDFESVRKKLHLDLEYIQQAGLSLDSRIIFSTIPRLVGFRTSRVTRFFRVYRRPRLPIWESHEANSSARRRRAHRTKRKGRAVLPR